MLHACNFLSSTEDSELLPYKIHGYISKHVDATMKVYVIFEHPSYIETGEVT